jgi:hypothetical protein
MGTRGVLTAKTGIENDCCGQWAAKRLRKVGEMAAKRRPKATETIETTGKKSLLQEQLEQVRASEQVNVLDRAGVQAMAATMGLKELAARCEQLRYDAHGYLDMVTGADDGMESEGTTGKESGDGDS